MGRTGAFCLLYAALQELEAGNGIPDLPLLVKKMRQQRKNMLQEKVSIVPSFDFGFQIIEIDMLKIGIKIYQLFKALLSKPLLCVISSST